MSVEEKPLVLMFGVDDLPGLYSGCVCWVSSELELLCRGWYLNGEYHREDGPAIEWEDGARRWFINGLKYRIDGPADISSSGCVCWMVAGFCYAYKRNNENIEYFGRDIITNKVVSIDLLNSILLDEVIGEYGLVWKKILIKTGSVVSIPMIPGMEE